MPRTTQKIYAKIEYPKREYMLEITGEEIAKFLNNKDGKLAEWWMSKLSTSKNSKESLKVNYWGVLISPIPGTNEQKYWIDFLPLRQSEHWQGKHLRLLVKLVG